MPLRLGHAQGGYCLGMSLGLIGAVTSSMPLRLGHAQGGYCLGMSLGLIGAVTSSMPLRLGHAQGGYCLGMSLSLIGALDTPQQRQCKPNAEPSSVPCLSYAEAQPALDEIKDKQREKFVFAFGFHYLCKMQCCV